MDKFRKDMEKIDRLSKPIEGWEKAPGGWGQDVRKVLPALLNEEEAGLARFQAFAALRSQFGKDGNEGGALRTPSAAMADTAEAVETAMRSNLDPQKDVQQEIRDILEKAQQAEEDQLKQMEELNKFFKENPNVIMKKKV